MDPVSAIIDAREVVKKRTGSMPNVIKMGDAAFDKLCRYLYAEAKPDEEVLITSILDVDRIEVYRCAESDFTYVCWEHEEE